MYIFRIHGKEYKVRFTYRQLCEGDILDKVTDAMSEAENTPRAVLETITRTAAELLLAGLQKYHEKEFGYKSDETKKERIEQLIDWFDDYEDEATEDHPQTAATLFSDLQEELRKNGFLSALFQAATENQTTATQEQTAETMTAEQPTVATESES